MVSSEIKSCIFGINSENKFEELKWSNNNSTTLFKTNGGEIFTLKMYREKEFASAFVKVKRTAVINENSSGFIKAKIIFWSVCELFVLSAYSVSSLM